MTAAVLAAVIVVLLARDVWQNVAWSRERARLVAACIAPTPQAAQAAVLPANHTQGKPPAKKPPLIAAGDDA